MKNILGPILQMKQGREDTEIPQLEVVTLH